MPYSSLSFIFILVFFSYSPSLYSLESQDTIKTKVQKFLDNQSQSPIQETPLFVPAPSSSLIISKGQSAPTILGIGINQKIEGFLQASFSLSVNKQNTWTPFLSGEYGEKEKIYKRIFWKLNMGVSQKKGLFLWGPFLFLEGVHFSFRQEEEYYLGQKIGREELSRHYVGPGFFIGVEWPINSHFGIQAISEVYKQVLGPYWVKEKGNVDSNYNYQHLEKQALILESLQFSLKCYLLFYF